MTAITRPFQWLGGSMHTGTRDDQDHDAILLAQDPPGCIARRAATQSISNTTFTDISYDTETADNDSMFAATSTTITIQHDGYQIILVGNKWASSATGTRAHGASINGTVQDEIACQFPGISGNPRYTFGGVIPLVTSDTVKINVWQDSGGALNYQGRLAVFRLSGPGS